LHRGIGRVAHFLTMSYGNPVKDFKQAFNRSEFQSKMSDVLPNVIMSPYLFKKVAVPGICVE